MRKEQTRQEMYLDKVDAVTNLFLDSAVVRDFVLISQLIRGLRNDIISGKLRPESSEANLIMTTINRGIAKYDDWEVNR